MNFAPVHAIVSSLRLSIAIEIVCLSSILLSSNVASADPPSRVVVFGSSYSDVGNVHELTGTWPPVPPYDDGRFCNGPVWHEIAGDALGWPEASASLVGGDIYAYGGAHAGSGATVIPCFPATEIPAIGDQIETFLQANTVEASDLFVIGINNDLNYQILNIGGDPPEIAVAEMVEHIETLAAEGAESFLVMNMIPLGDLPFVANSGNSALGEDLTNQYNAMLEPAMQETADALDVDIKLLDAHGIFTEVIEDPATFGFSNITDPAQIGGQDVCTVIDGGTPVPNPDEYAWWDYSHATTAVHELLGEAVINLFACPTDLDSSGTVDTADLLQLLSTWGPCEDCPEDIDNNGAVNTGDLLELLSAWGAC